MNGNLISERLYVALQRHFRELIIRWNSIAPELAVECFEAAESVYAVKEVSYHSQHITLREYIVLERQVSEQSHALMPTWKRHLELEGNVECLQELQYLLDTHTLRHSLASTWASKDQLQRILSDYTAIIIMECTIKSI